MKEEWQKAFKANICKRKGRKTKYASTSYNGIDAKCIDNYPLTLIASQKLYKYNYLSYIVLLALTELKLVSGNNSMHRETAKTKS